MSFPKCVEILLASYGKLLWNDVQKWELTGTVRWYRETGDSEKVMEEISLKLNDWAKYKVPDFVDTCPLAHLGMIMSPDKTLDWTRAVWLIYSELSRHFHLTFTDTILMDMESSLNLASERSLNEAQVAPIPFAGRAHEAMARPLTLGRRGDHVCMLLERLHSLAL